MKKRTILSFILIIALISTSLAQDFEGKVVYKNSYKSKNTAISDDQLNVVLGNAQEFYVKNGNYKNVPNGQMIQWQIYLNKDNKLYSKMAMSPSVYWDEGSQYHDEVVKAEVKKNALEILGYSCDELTLTCKSGIQKFYYNSKFPMDPKYYVNHKFGNWNEFVSRAKAVPLKIYLETKEFTVESIATEINPQAVPDNIFELPAGAKLEKNPFTKQL